MNIFGGVLILLKFLNRHIIKTFLPILLFPIQNLHTLCDKNKTAVEAEFAE